MYWFDSQTNFNIRIKSVKKYVSTGNKNNCEELNNTIKKSDFKNKTNYCKVSKLINLNYKIKEINYPFKII